MRLISHKPVSGHSLNYFGLKSGEVIPNHASTTLPVYSDSPLSHKDDPLFAILPNSAALIQANVLTLSIRQRCHGRMTGDERLFALTRLTAQRKFFSAFVVVKRPRSPSEQKI